MPLISQVVFAAPEAEADDNGGILNGPLMQGGHKASHMGTKETLAMAITDMIESHGGDYPMGEVFLERLGKISSEKDPAFDVLKREALLANPALAFDKILLVRNVRGARFTPNWCNRASMPSPNRKINVGKELKNFEKKLIKKDVRIAGMAQLVKATRDARHADEASAELKARLAQQQAALDEAIHQHPDYQRMAAQLGDKANSATYQNELVMLSLKDGCKITPIMVPDQPMFIGDVDLHWDADRILFSSHRVVEGKGGQSGGASHWAVFELRLDPESGLPVGSPRVVSPDWGTDVDSFDAAYLPDGRILFASTASYQGVPCVGGSQYVSNLYRVDADGGNAKRLTFDQESNWNPSVMEDGRVLYTRWEYTDTAHYFSRLVMSMNPDGTNQRSHYGSNSYWPNSMFHVRQIPGKVNQFVATVTGHHDTPKNGPLVLFDVAKGRAEADGAVQILTGRGQQVQPIVHDRLTRNYAPLFCHPYPLSEKVFLAGNNSGEIFLVDVFDNVLKLTDRTAGQFYEPTPCRKVALPKIIPDRSRPGEPDATVMINDVYYGPGLEGVPRGTVKSLRVYRYEFSPRHSGSHYAMGMESGWDAKQVLGTVPVEDDGSANFKVPANTPLAVQPLDEDGRAVQLMRSWMVAMPGESLSCVGCHENQNSSPPNQRYGALTRAPSIPEPFYGPTRGFSFKREVQPVLDKYCIACHDGTKDLDDDGRDRTRGFQVADRIIGSGPHAGEKMRLYGIPDFTKGDRVSHQALHPYVRRNGPEGDYHLLTPLEFHVNTSELFQMLEKGHHGVDLDQEAWDRLTTWADLNAPLHGTWSESSPGSKSMLARRQELRQQISGSTYDAEAILAEIARGAVPVEPTLPKRLGEPASPVPQPPRVNNDQSAPLVLDLGDQVTMKLVGIPSGEFSMGSNDESPMEGPVARVKIAKPFHMAATEVTLRQFRQFEADYLNGVYDMHYKDQVHRGYYMNDMDYPVIRVSWDKAMAFCEWLSNKTGKAVTLPTEAEWEWACRAGTTTPLWFGSLDSNFSSQANLSDVTVKKMAVKGVNPQPISNPSHDLDYELKDPRSDDGALHLAEVGSYAANPWGLFDMHGNAAEWTLSRYQRYPYAASDGRNGRGMGERVVRGGSWHDRMFRATSSYRLGFPSWQRVYHTGFRVAISE